MNHNDSDQLKNLIEPYRERTRPPTNQPITPIFRAIATDNQFDTYRHYLQSLLSPRSFLFDAYPAIPGTWTPKSNNYFQEIFQNL